MRRRTFVLTAAGVSTLGLAGCVGGGDDSSDGGSDSSDDGSGDDSSDGGSDSSGDGSGDGSDDGSGDGSGDGSDDGSDDGTGDGSDDGSDGGSGDGSDDGSDGGSGDGSSDGSGDDSSAGSDDGSSDGSGDGSSDGGTSGPLVGEHAQWTDSFIAEITVKSSNEIGTMTLRSSGGNYYQTIETSQGALEIYNVDGDIYFVQGNQCFMNPGSDMTPDPETGVNPQEEDAVLGDDPNITPAGRETIDGEEMYVYETSSGGTTTSIYINVETGYLRRVETPQATMDYHSWGEVAPIEAPDDCQSM